MTKWLPILLLLAVSVSASEFWGTTTEAGNQLTSDGAWEGGRFFCPVSGALDSIGFFLRVTGLHDSRVAIYNADHTFLDSSYIRSVDDDTAWFWFDPVNNATVTAGNSYWIVVWSQVVPNDVHSMWNASGGDSTCLKSLTFAGVAWPQSMDTVSAMTKYVDRLMSIRVAVTPSGFYAVGQAPNYIGADAYTKGSADSATNYSTSNPLYFSCYNVTTGSKSVVVENLAMNQYIAGKTVDSAKLSIVLSMAENNGGDSVFSIAKLLRNTTMSQVDYNEYVTGSSWTAVGGTGAGTDYASTDSITIEGGDSAYAAGDTVTLNATDWVTAWAADTTTNNGAIWFGVTGSGYTVYGIYSNEEAVRLRRPIWKVWARAASTGPVNYRVGPGGSGVRTSPDGSSKRSTP